MLGPTVWLLGEHWQPAKYRLSQVGAGVSHSVQDPLPPTSQGGGRQGEQREVGGKQPRIQEAQLPVCQDSGRNSV